MDLWEKPLIIEEPAIDDSENEYLESNDSLSMIMEAEEFSSSRSIS